MKKTLVVFYSRTGTTKKLAQTLVQKLGADIEEITTPKDRKGLWGYLVCGREAMKRISAEINQTQKDPKIYDLVIVGTPMWAMNFSSPARAYISRNKEDLKELAFFCTRGGEKIGKIFEEMENAANKKPTAVLALRTKEVVSGNFDQKLNEFINKLSI
jgi:flavodoxin